MNILLTGSAGFLGRRVLKRLLAQGHKVIALERTPVHRTKPGLLIVQQSLCDLNSNSLPWAEIDTVIHLAATGIRTPLRTWTATLEANVVGTYRLLSLISTHGCRRPQVFLAASYYERFIGKIPFFSENPYVATKHAASSITKIWAETHPAAVVIADLFQLYGPGDYAEHVLSYAAAAIKEGRKASFGSATSLRDWLYIDDAADAVLKILQPLPPGVSKWDIGSGELRSIRSVIEEMACLNQYDLEKLSFDPSRDRGDWVESCQAKNLPPGWAPSTSITEGLRRLLADAE